MDGWKTIVSFSDGLFSGAFAVSFREGTPTFLFFFGWDWNPKNPKIDHEGFEGILSLVLGIGGK